MLYLCIVLLLILTCSISHASLIPKYHKVYKVASTRMKSTTGPIKLHMRFNNIDLNFNLVPASVFAPDAIISIHDKGKVVHQIKAIDTPYYHSTYKQADGDERTVRIQMNRDGSMQGIFQHNGEMHAVEPHHRIVGNPMVVYKLSTLDMEGILFAAPRGVNNRTNKFAPVVHPGCPTPSKMYMGIFADHHYYNVFGSTSGTIAAITNNVNSMNGIYIAQLNVKTYVSSMVIKLSYGGSDWNAQVCPDIDTKLDQISASSDIAGVPSNGLWHLFTNCYPPPGTIGLAWLGVMCQPINNVAITNYLPGSAGFLVFAHEIGHNFNAEHDATGIMTAVCCSSLHEFSTTSLNEMCAHLGTSPASTCLTPDASICGASFICDEATTTVIIPGGSSSRATVFWLLVSLSIIINLI